MPLHLLSSLLFGVSASADSLVMGLSYGIRKTPIGWKANLLAGLICLAGTVLSMALGQGALAFLSPHFAGLAGGALILSIGAAGLACFWRSRKKGREADAVHPITLRQTVALGLALAVNNMALGVGAGITGLALAPTALSTLACSLMFLYGGNRLGQTRLSEPVGKFAEPLAGLLMIGLGLYEIFV